MSRTVLILGAGVMQLPALRLARDAGWRVLVADGNPAAVGRDLADEFVQIDLRDRDELLRYAGERQRGAGLDGVFTAGTDFSTSVAWVAERLGLPGIDYQTALIASDKELMRRRLREAGVAVPRFTVVREIPAVAERRRICDEIGLPLVVKPVDSMGARGVRRIECDTELEAAVGEAMQHSGGGRVMVEELIDGPEFSVDAIVWHGRISFCGIADRDIRFAPWFIEVGHTMPTAAPDHVVRRLRELFKAAVRAIGIENGAAKGDLFLGRSGPVVGEIAARLSGGYMSGWTYPYASGVEPTRAGLNIAVGEPPGDLQPQRALVSCERAVISIPGRVRGVSGFAAARQLAGVREVFQRCAPGAQVVFPRNNVEKCGNVITVAETRDAALAAAERALQEIAISLVPGDQETMQFLFNDGHGLYSPAIAAFPALMQRLQREQWGKRVQRGSGSGATSVVPQFDPAVIARLRLDEAEKDWNGRTLSQTVRLLAPDAARRHQSESGAAAGSDRSLLWRAVAKGGLQGGRFFLDTVEEMPELFRG